LLALGHKALTALEWAVDHVEEHPAEGVRASQILMDRVLPKPGATQAVYVNLGGAGHTGADPAHSPGEIIRKRLAELAAASADREEMRYSATDPGEWPGEIIDAEIVDEAS
jgi:hypothetical protein